MSVYTKSITRKSKSPLSLDPFRGIAHSLLSQSATLLSGVMVAALLAFELFNFSTTNFALTDLLGDLQLVSVRWSTILALAFAGMDFAGLAWLFTSRSRLAHGLGSWYLIAAWFLAATMNAMLTWWSVSLALLRHEALGNELITRQSLLYGAPIFVAALVWLLRILLIGSFTLKAARPGEQSQAWGAPSTTGAGAAEAGKVPARLVPSKRNGRVVAGRAFRSGLARG